MPIQRIKVFLRYVHSCETARSVRRLSKISPPEDNAIVNIPMVGADIKSPSSMKLAVANECLRLVAFKSIP